MANLQDTLGVGAREVKTKKERLPMYLKGIYIQTTMGIDLPVIIQPSPALGSDVRSA